MLKLNLSLGSGWLDNSFGGRFVGGILTLGFLIASLLAANFERLHLLVFFLYNADNSGDDSSNQNCAQERANQGIHKGLLRFFFLCCKLSYAVGANQCLVPGVGYGSVDAHCGDTGCIDKILVLGCGDSSIFTKCGSAV